MTLSLPEQNPSPTQDMGQLLETMGTSMKPLRRGDVVEGVVMRIDPEGILVHIGHKAEGIVHSREMRTLNPEELKVLKLGEPIITFVIRPETADSPAILSVDKAVGEKGWILLEKTMEAGETVEGKIIGFNRGGAIVEVAKIQGFVPLSQLVSVSRDQFRGTQEAAAPQAEGQSAPLDGAPPKETVNKDVGKSLQLKVLEVNRGRNRAIFSERQAIQEWRDERKARLVEELREGETRRGKVTGISNFGAFVDLGGADGLIHISELSWSPVNSPQDIVKVGDEIDVFILRVDIENKKIALSLRRLQPEPWETINERYKTGDVVNATITKLTNFGAFARVEGVQGSVEGLIHISELTERMINHPREVVREGDAVKVKILRIEPERRRLGLSLKQADEDMK